MRVNKYLSECGFCSRREADKLIEENAVFINDRQAVFGDQVEIGDKVVVNGKEIKPLAAHNYLAFNKPVGIVCTLSLKEKNNLAEFLQFDGHITYAGRLDKASCGLIILTDDGDLIDKLMTGRNGHEKEYVVTVYRGLNKEKIDAMQKGLYLEEIGKNTRPCKAWITGENEFHIILTQGINRQIRRMCKAVGMSVKDLKRIRVENVELGDLKPGKTRKLTTAEVNELKKRAGL